MRIFRLLFLILLFTANCKAQILDSINYSLHQKPKFFVNLTSQNTFIDKQYASVGGLRMGLNYNQLIRFGIGYSILTNNSVVSDIHFNENNLEYVTAAELHLHYFSFSAEYFVFNKYPWQFTITPFNIGIGSAKYEYVRRPEMKKVFGPSETIIFYQPEGSVQFNILRWLGVGTTLGYRFTILRSKEQTQHLNSIAFSLDAKIFLDELVKDILMKSEE